MAARRGARHLPAARDRDAALRHLEVLDEKPRFRLEDAPERAAAGDLAAGGRLGEPAALQEQAGAPGRAHGELEFLGRTDFQVKIRGFRVELGEVESALYSCAQVRHAVATAAPDPSGEQKLVAYVELKSGLDGSGVSRLITAHVCTKVPPFMVPSQVVVLERMPMTPNGKIDRNALPDPSPSRAGADVEWVPPRGQAEEKHPSDRLRPAAERIEVKQGATLAGPHLEPQLGLALDARVRGPVVVGDLEFGDVDPKCPGELGAEWIRGLRGSALVAPAARPGEQG